MNQADFIDVPFRVSPCLAWLLATIHAAAIVAILVLPVPWWLRAIACTLVLLSAAVQIYRRALLKGNRACLGLRLMRDGSCQLQIAGDRSVSGHLCRGWFVSPQLVVMRISCPGERLSRDIALLPDSASPDDLRRLRVFLRFAVNLSGRH
jgi:toxin CptA